MSPIKPHIRWEQYNESIYLKRGDKTLAYAIQTKTGDWWVEPHNAGQFWRDTREEATKEVTDRLGMEEAPFWAP